MKKTIAIVLSLVMLLLCTSALADVVTLGSTGLRVTIPSSYEEDALTDEDEEEGMIGYYYNNQIDVAIYAFDAEGYDLATWADYFCSEYDPSANGETVINGTTFYYLFYTVQDEEYGEYLCLEYLTVINNQIADLCFYFTDVSLSSQVSTIMETVK